MHTLKLLACSMIAACHLDAHAAENPAVNDLSWLSGHWCQESGGALIEEYWLAARGGSLLGLSRTVKVGELTGFEYLRIESREGALYYVAQPGGAPPTEFRRTASGAGWARFENPAHDFPRRIVYRRSGTSLHAEISGPGMGGKEQVIAFEYFACEQ